MGLKKKTGIVLLLCCMAAAAAVIWYCLLAAGQRSSYIDGTFVKGIGTWQAAGADGAPEAGCAASRLAA